MTNHDEIQELLPWYANGSLSDDEVKQVESHLATCDVCQGELTGYRQLREAVNLDEQPVWTPSASHFETLLASVDKYETRSANTRRQSGWLERLLPWLRFTPAPARFALAAQGVFAIVLATLLVYHSVVPVETYRTLSNPVPETTAPGQLFRVVFADGATEKNIRSILIPLKAQVVAGPTSVGAYTIAIALDRANPRAMDDALTQLRSNSNIQLAEVVAEAGQ